MRRLRMSLFSGSWTIPHLKWYDHRPPSTPGKKDNLMAMIFEDTLGRLLLTAIVMSDDRFFVGAGIGANRRWKSVSEVVARWKYRTPSNT